MRKATPKKHRLRLAAAFGAALALTLPFTGASADPNQIVTDPTVNCTVFGTVTLDPPLTDTPANREYTFVDTVITCAGTHPAFGPVAATYDVTATGDTDSINHDGSGEDCAQGGWDQNDHQDDDPTDGPGDGETVGILDADLSEGQGPSHLDGTVKFHRRETVVVAYGTLSIPGASAPFSAELQFTPTDGTCVTTPVSTALLDGVAQIGTTTTPVGP